MVTCSSWFQNTKNESSSLNHNTYEEHCLLCSTVYVGGKMLGLYLGLITMQQAALKQIQLDHTNRIIVKLPETIANFPGTHTNYIQ